MSLHMRMILEVTAFVGCGDYLAILITDGVMAGPWRRSR